MKWDKSDAINDMKSVKLLPSNIEKEKTGVTDCGSMHSY